MIFNVLKREELAPTTGMNEAFLKIDFWNDYDFKTMFYVWLFDADGTRYELGNVRIGILGQRKETSTFSTLASQFEGLDESYFSLATDVEYYETLGRVVPEATKVAFLKGMQDVVAYPERLEGAAGQDVLRVSLLRNVSVSLINGQFTRVLNGGVPLTDFRLAYKRPDDVALAGVELQFNVKASSKPSTNIHAVIGRNGVGKTTLLNGMIEAITNPRESSGKFYEISFIDTPIQKDYFSNLVSVSFSAFDPFTPPQEQPNPELGTCYYYIGLKDMSDESGTLLRSLSYLHDEFVDSLSECFQARGKRDRWLAAINTLMSDDNFSEMDLQSLMRFSGDELKDASRALIKRMSSGHAIVLLTITRLVAKVEEKTLVLLDEPESHLHPPLLSAFTRALSELLFDRNGVAIIATHSPVVLQEVPKSCVWKITRSRMSLSSERPDVETFGENVGILTREVFGLEVAKSGYHALLAKAVENGEGYDEIVAGYGGQLGLEAKAILRAMVSERELGAGVI
ncbi:AAA family ATPase [Rhizobium tumorigenes]|uniref:AAA family ATPase n=1 Tax=Rhizobium tumorigenes TaxID=2041385 RepID=A0AAF1KRJ7_9HYPH|nr:AAA family ATPase [Rhizobium tumorigenes]WFR96293.1 AAA family ATPase [Rhizobium tumorigenes]